MCKTADSGAVTGMLWENSGLMGGAPSGIVPRGNSLYSWRDSDDGINRLSARIMVVTSPAPSSELEPSKNELDVLKGQFLASLNHEIRTPLSGIMGGGDRLLETNRH